MPNTQVLQQVSELVSSWKEETFPVNSAFLEFQNYLAGLNDVTLSFKSRPGVSYSLRATHKNQNKRELFVMVDIVDDDPSARWLSVCFYADMISDPEELGDYAPGGLNGEDACCLNLEEQDTDMQNYIFARIQEAASSAAK